MRCLIYLMFLSILSCQQKANKNINPLTINKNLLVEKLILRKTTNLSFENIAKEMKVDFDVEFIEGYENNPQDSTVYYCGNDERIYGTRKIYTNDSLKLSFTFNLLNNQFLLKEYQIGDFSKFSFKNFNPNHLNATQLEKDGYYFYDETFYKYDQNETRKEYYYERINDSIIALKGMNIQAQL